MNKLKNLLGSLSQSVLGKSSKSKKSNQEKQKKKKGVFSKVPLPIKITFGIISMVVFIILLVGMATMPQPSTEETAKVCTTAQSDTTNANDTDVSGDWTKDGTSANKIAKEIWDYWNKKGYSAAAIAGVLGNVYAESGFNPIVAQGGGSILKDTPQGGGAGLYQFTPYTKFAQIGDSKWKDVSAQSDYVWSSEAHGFSGYATMTNVGEAAQK